MYRSQSIDPVMMVSTQCQSSDLHDRLPETVQLAGEMVQELGPEYSEREREIGHTTIIFEVIRVEAGFLQK